MIERNADGMIVVDQRGIIRFANPSAESLYMRWAEELVGTTFDEPLEVTQTAREIGIQRIDGTHVRADLRLVEIHWDSEPAFLASLRMVGPDAANGPESAAAPTDSQAPTPSQPGESGTEKRG